MGKLRVVLYTYILVYIVGSLIFKNLFFEIDWGIMIVSLGAICIVYLASSKSNKNKSQR